MARPLKVFKTHIGFYDLIVAAPSMKAAAEAWGAHERLFAQGLAEKTQEAEAVKAALAEPGVVLKRLHGKKGPYTAEPEPPPMPKLSAGQKKKAKAARADRARQDAAERKAKEKVARQAEEDAAKELAAIEAEEAKLRERRNRLKAKFRLRSVK
jgi:hypothetical protein